MDYMISHKETVHEKSILYYDPKYADGRVEAYTPSEGIDVFYSDMLTKAPYSYRGEYDRANTLEINYCLSGKYECEFKDQTIIYLQDGDFSMWSGKGEVVASDSSYKRYQGITIYLDVEKAKKAIQPLLPGTPIDFGFLLHETLSGKTSIVAKPGEKILHIFNELYNLPNKYVLDYIRLKIAELFLLIYTGDFKYEENKDRYYPRTLVQSAKNARKYIDEHFYEHFTIADLARQCTVNSKKLMECFKYIYGMTINDCIQQARMVKAGELLLQTDFKVGEVASLVGYDSASKFTELFKRHYGLLPMKYRQTHGKKK